MWLRAMPSVVCTISFMLTRAHYHYQAEKYVCVNYLEVVQRVLGTASTVFKLAKCRIDCMLLQVNVFVYQAGSCGEGTAVIRYYVKLLLIIVLHPNEHI